VGGMSTVPDVLSSIAVARYRKSARSPFELKQEFQKAVLDNKKPMKVEAELEKQGMRHHLKKFCGSDKLASE